MSHVEDSEPPAALTAPRPRLTATLNGGARAFDPTATHVVGVLIGEGVGHEVVPVALAMLDVLRAKTSRRFDIRAGGLIGYPAKEVFGSSLSHEVVGFAADIFDSGGALFCGPGGERFVYELRRAFDLYCKYTPLEPLPELRGAGALRASTVDGADIIAVRENMGGIYQGEWALDVDSEGARTARHDFSYSDAQIRRILHVAMRLAATRKGRVHVILKPGGIPSISQLWRICADDLAADYGIDLIEQEIDNAVYQLIADPSQFDVLVSPNMFGDVLADCGSLLLASRGLSYSGNFGDRGRSAFQTGHGAARDIAGKDVANPIGQIFALGMMLRESFDWPEADSALRAAVRTTLRQGLCTHDIAMPGHEPLGTTAFGAKLKANLEAILEDHDL
ncbi:MAG TPA: isocitrate/isopropylmalate family dehydrogenase [Allosphingosinicella sp.]|nr:isocitrate/isopropylmalate family dehydrogenase [Allosphingosinicella sp.]